MALLLCDLDDTLVDRREAFLSWAGALAAEHDASDDLVPWLVGIDEAGYSPRGEFLGAVRQRLGLASTPEEMTEWFHATFFTMYRSDPDVLDALRDARTAGWAIAIVTNGGPAQADKVRSAGLDAYVDAVCISAVEGFAKPDRRLLDRAAERCGVSLDGAWMVGDNPAIDIGAAVAAGVDSVWVRHGLEWPPDLAYRPTHVADTGADAMRLVLADDVRGGQRSR